MKEKLISFRLPAGIDKEIERIATLNDSDKSKLIRELLILGIRAKKLDEAIKAYSDGRISLAKAARLADISLWRMMEVMKEREVEIHYTEEQLRDDLTALYGEIK